MRIVDVCAFYAPRGGGVKTYVERKLQAGAAAGHEIIRQRRKNLTLIRMTPDLLYDQMIGAGCATKLVSAVSIS